MTINKLDLMNLVVTINRDIFKMNKELAENGSLNNAAKACIANLNKVLEQVNAELVKD